MESSAAIGPGPATICAWLSDASETVKPPLALPLTCLRRTAPVSTRPVLLISMGVKSHCDSTASPVMVKKGLLAIVRLGQDFLPPHGKAIGGGLRLAAKQA